MNKQLTTIAAITLIATTSMAQQAVKLNGQPFGSSDWIGSSNNESVIFKANNNVGLKIKPNGEVVFKSLDLNSSTGPNGIVVTDGQGKLSRLNFSGNANQVLLANGTFGTLPSAQWSTSGNNLYWNAGNVAIGAEPNSSFKLVVGGDARVANDLFVNHDLFVGGGVIISDKIQGVTEVKGWDFKVENDIQVTGSARFNGVARLDQGFTFDGSKGIKFVPNHDNGGTFRYGNNNVFQTLGVPCAAAPTTNISHQFGGIVQVFDPNDPNTGLLNLQTWAGGSSIDASVNGLNDPAALLLNYFCGNDVAICTGVNGGTVAVGNKFQANKNVRIGYYGSDPFDPNTSLLISQSTPNANALKFYTWEPTVKLLSIESPGLAYSTFSVFGDGKTEIKSNNENPLDIINPATGKSNFRVKNTGVVYSREVNVQLADYPDYVFAQNYSLMPLDVLDKYITTNKHLPNVPSAKEIETNGANLGELNKIQMEKIEELTLYIIEMKKELEALKKQVNNSK